MVHHGIDMGCCKGEFLSINDGDVYHTELMWYYSQLRWRAVYEVRGESWQDFVNMLVWGGVGTCMDADLPFLLAKWATTLTPKSATKDVALESNHAPVPGNMFTCAQIYLAVHIIQYTTVHQAHLPSLHLMLSFCRF
jgi:hypothetical protein